MNLSAPRYILSGILTLLILVGIPLTVYFVKQQNDLRSRANPTSILSIEPETITNAVVNKQFEVKVYLTPNENKVTFVKFKLLFDPAYLEAVEITENKTNFPLKFDPPTVATGSASVALGIGPQPLAAIQAKTEVATIKFRPLKATGTTPVTITFDNSAAQILSLAKTDEPAENVLQSKNEAKVTINNDTDPNTSPTPTSVPTNNTPPLCTEMSLSPSASGKVPFAITITAQGIDEDGIITKATFNYGDGQIQDITQNTNKDAVTVQANHTYTRTGTFSTTVTFTDDKGGISASCAQAVEVTGETGGTNPTIAPTTTPVATVAPTEAVDISPTEIPTPTALPTKAPIPTLEPTGDTTTTIGIVGGILLALVGGVLLFSL